MQTALLPLTAPCCRSCAEIVVPFAWCCKTGFSEQTPLCADVESEAQQEVLHSFGDAKGLTFSRDGKLLAVGVVDAVHIHEWPSLLHRASIRYAMHAVPAVPQLHSCQQAMGCIATQLILCCRKEKHALTDAVRDIDFSRGHANNAVHMQLASCACQPPQSHTAWHASSYLPMHILISYMINACLAQVIAVACEDGTCSLWLWAQAVCVDSLQLPPGGGHGIADNKKVWLIVILCNSTAAQSTTHFQCLVFAASWLVGFHTNVCRMCMMTCTIRASTVHSLRTHSNAYLLKCISMYACPACCAKDWDHCYPALLCSLR